MGLMLTKFALVNWSRKWVISKFVIAGFRVGQGMDISCVVLCR